MMRTSTHSRPTRRQAGFSLLEVLIATLVLSAGLLGLAGLQIAGMKTTHNSYQMQQATWLVHDLLERMRVNRAGNYNSTLYGTAACDTAPTPCTACTPAETVERDLYHARCGTGTVGGLHNDLTNAELKVTCASGSCLIELKWQDRNASSKVGGNTENAAINLNVIL